MIPAIRKFSRHDLRQAMPKSNWSIQGKVCDIIGTIVEAYLPNCQLGALVEINLNHSHEHVLAEVVGFRDERVLLLPYGDLAGVAPGCAVTARSMFSHFSVGSHLLGKVIDPFGNTLASVSENEKGPSTQWQIDRMPPNPLERNRIEKPLSLGIRAIDGLLTFGAGQRLGIFAGSGVGKSVLMGMIAKGTEADVNVIALIGERGREVREFLERDLGMEGLKRSVVIVSTSDQSPLMKIRAAKAATAVAEYFASLGRDVLLMMDSLTRVAMAQREVGLSIGEPPTTKGYTPSVFAMLPRLLERSGPQRAGWGNISGLYTVLVDGDDFDDPIADAARSILDGHLHLTRSLAAKGHYPAIDISTSTSRVMPDIVSRDHLDAAIHIRGLMGVFLENYDLIQIGAYQPGANPRLDEAMAMMPAIERFLLQRTHDQSTLPETIMELRKLLAASKQLSDQEAFERH